MKTRKVPQPGWNLEYMMWMFTRLSGLLFFLAAIIGVAVALFMGARAPINKPTATPIKAAKKKNNPERRVNIHIMYSKFQPG